MSAWAHEVADGPGRVELLCPLLPVSFLAGQRKGMWHLESSASTAERPAARPRATGTRKCREGTCSGRGSPLVQQVFGLHAGWILGGAAGLFGTVQSGALLRKKKVLCARSFHSRRIAQYARVGPSCAGAAWDGRVSVGGFRRMQGVALPSFIRPSSLVPPPFLFLCYLVRGRLLALYLLTCLFFPQLFWPWLVR